MKHCVRSKDCNERELRQCFLVELGGEHENLVVLDADLAAATKTGMFKKAFPDRHIDCGIAEANMTGVAAGMSTMWICTVSRAPSPCLRQDVLTSRCAIPSDIRI